MNLRRRGRRIRLLDLWVVVAPATFLAIGISLLGAKLIFLFFGKKPDFSEVLSTFQGTLSPKPVQQLRYLLLLASWPIIVALGMKAMAVWRKRGGAFSRVRFERRSLAFGRTVLWVGVLWNIIFQEAFVHHFFMGRSPNLALGLLAFALALYLSDRVLCGRGKRMPESRYVDYACATVAVLVVAVELLACVFTDRNFFATPPGVFTHLPYTFGEFAAVAGGKTLSVDFFPQYQQLLPYLFSPFFRVFGLNLTVFTTGLALLSFLSIACVYGILKRTSRGPGLTLFLFLSWLGVAFLPIETYGSARYLAFTYFAVAPLRFIGFWSVAYFTLRTASGTSTPVSRMLCIFWATLVALNNFDFGIPVFVACLFSLLVFVRDRKKTLLAGGTGISAAALVYLGIPWIRTGEFPDLGGALRYLLAAGKVGYTSWHTPTWGYHWIFILGALLGLALGLMQAWNSREGDRDEDLKKRSLSIALTFFGIAGSGAFAYYMNRSHWHVMTVTGAIAFFPILLLAAAFFDRKRISLLPGLDRIPRIVLIVFVACGIALLKNLPNPVSQWNRIVSGDDSFLDRQKELAALIARNQNTGEKTAICYPFAETLALQAGVANVFPYPLGGSLLLRSQLREAIRVIEANHVKVLFGDLPEELRAWALSEGFKETERNGDFSVLKQRAI